MAGKVYFGNKTKQTWIKAPQSGMKASSIGYSSESQLLSGRTVVRRSKGSHRRFDASWLGSLNTSDTETSLQTIKNFHDGLYGDGPFYWLDPFAKDQNILPEHWAAPMLAEKDWPKLSYDIVPTFTSASVANDYPVKYATYSTSDAYESPEKLVVIIPEGYKFHFGWHGPSGVGATTGIRIVPYLRADGTAAAAINPAMLVAGGTKRTNTSLNGNTYSYVEIFIGTDEALDVAITAMIARVIIDSETVPNGGFIPGKGTTKLEFATAPTFDYYTSAINDGQIGMSASWVETE